MKKRPSESASYLAVLRHLEADNGPALQVTLAGLGGVHAVRYMLFALLEKGQQHSLYSVLKLLE